MKTNLRIKTTSQITMTSKMKMASEIVNYSSPWQQEATDPKPELILAVLTINRLKILHTSAEKTTF